MDELLQLFQYPPRSSRALPAGTLFLRFCAARVAGRTPTWRFLVSGYVASLVTVDLWVAEGGGAEDARREIHWVK